MSKFSRVLALSKTPADFQKPAMETVAVELTTTVATEPKTTIVVAPATTVVDKSITTVIWQAENGAIFPSSRVRRVDLAQHALTHAEESVYDYLWGAKTQSQDEFRLVRAGYDRIAKAARVTKRNAALIVERLAQKGFLREEQPADSLHRVPTQYRVLGYRAVLDELDRQGHRWVVKSGNGVLFVRRMKVSTTVVDDLTTTVVPGQSTTVVAATTVTMVAGLSTTVVAATTPRDNKKEMQRETTSSSVVREVQQAIAPLELGLDDDGVSQIIAASRDANPGARTQEIIHFIQVAVQCNHRGNVRTWGGFLKTAVPKYLTDGSTTLAAYRKEQEAQQSREVEARRQAQTVLIDPQSSEQERQWALTVLADTS